MEAFEQFVALAMESEGLVVSSAVKFRVPRKTRKQSHPEIQTHGYEVDLIGARADRLVLATVKSFFGSQGVVADQVTRAPRARGERNHYALLNDPEIRDGVIRAACDLYGYPERQVQLRLYAGRFAGRTTGVHEEKIRRWCASQRVGAGPIGVFGVRDVIDSVQRAAVDKQYRDNPVLVTMKVLREAGLLQ